MNKKIKAVAIKAAKKAGKALLKEFKNFNRSTVKFKTAHEILTKADLLSEKIILNEIKNNFPTHRILSEEKGENKNISDFLWIVDPLDGTTNFSMHNPLWSISIGLAYKNEIILGVIYAPFLGEIFVAEKGKGATLNNKKIKVSKIKGDKALNTFCHGRENKHIEKAIFYYSQQKLKGFDCRQLGSAAIELGFVACGRTESLIIPGANSWDVAAGALIVKEAGGKVADFKNKLWDIKSNDILASNILVHKDVLKLIK